MANITMLAEAILAVAAAAAGILGFFGRVPVSSERAAQMILTLGGLVALAFVVEATERRRVMGGLDDTHQALQQLLGNESLRQVPPDEIDREITRMLAESKDWLFRGGSARFLRGTTLPTLNSKARTLQIPVMIALLDPRDLDLCDSYATYRRKIGRVDPTVSARSIQAEILGTMYLAGWYAAIGRLETRLVLLRSFSQLRYDVGSSGLLATVADRRKPALYASSESWFYRSLRDELEQLVHGNPEVAFSTQANSHFPTSRTSVTAADVGNALANASVNGEPLLIAAAQRDQVEWELVKDAVVNPYEPNT